MKKIIIVLYGLLCWLSLPAQEVLPRPNPPRLVNDVAGVLSPEQRQILEDKLVALDDSTSNQVAVVLIRTLNDYPIEDYAVKLFRAWGIGNRNTNNGVLILAAVDDRKIRIEVGYGLEGAIPDITTASIIRNDIVPYFQQGNYFRGLDRAIESLGKAAAGEYKVKRERKPRGGGNGRSLLGMIVVLIIFLVMAGRGGRGGGGMVSRRGYRSFGGPVIFPGGWGGGGFGGGGGGGFGGGGFGGFGGGSSGGGGASGSW